jgi:pyruvate/2-oxoglutarate dehydrogenase complex dihydrolipoamide dehydrogenase (E3) component
VDYDFLVLGGGSAGYAAARTAAGLGLRTAVIEGGREVGGLCILRGCMPSKTLIESANRMRAIRQAGDFGLEVEGVRADLPAVIARKRALIGEFADDRRGQLEDGRFDFVRGRARFAGPHEVVVELTGGGERRVTARTFLVGTGSEHAEPPVPGLAEAGAFSSDDVLGMERLPASVVVLGAGPVALEMSHYMEAMGVRVTIVQRSPQLLRGLDTDVAGVVEAAFRRRGIAIHTGTTLTGILKDGVGSRVVVFEQDGVEHRVEAEAVFNGLGRVPATGNLGLELAGVSLEGRTIVTGQDQATSAPHIFAAGDCCSPMEIVHIAIRQGEIAAANAAAHIRGEAAVATMDYRLALFAVFTEPQAAVVGLSENEAARRGVKSLCAAYHFDDHGKSLVMGEREGFVKLIVDPGSREILGGAIVGPHASDLIHEIVVAMAFRATAAQLATIPHYHPTLAEIWTYPAEELA